MEVKVEDDEEDWEDFSLQTLRAVSSCSPVNVLTPQTQRPKPTRDGMCRVNNNGLFSHLFLHFLQRVRQMTEAI